MRHLFAAALLLAPLAAFAASPCKYPSPRNLQLDLAGVHEVEISVNGQNLHLTGSESAKGFSLNGRACASDKSALDDLQVTHRRDGDRLLIEMGGNHHSSLSLFGNSYANLEVNVQLPAGLTVTVGVGSGDADVTGVREMKTHVGSGDLHLRHIAGAVSASVGSGDIDASDIGSLDLGSVGSGDFKGEGIRGDVRIGSIGSGDVTLRRIGGSVQAQTLGSGDLQVHGVGGDFSLGAKGSGDVDHADVKGKVSVPHDDD